MYKAIFDGGHFIDGEDFDTLEEAKDVAMDVMYQWMADAMSDGMEAWDTLINECMCWVQEYDEESGEWIDCWFPPLDDMLWKYTEEMSDKELVMCGFKEEE